MTKKILSLAIALCLVCSLTLPAVADGFSIMASECIRSCSVLISAKAGGVMEAGCSVNCNNTASSISITLRIQEKQSSGSWSTVKTTTSSTTNNDSHSASTTYTGKAGTEYRATATVNVTYNGTTETRTPQTAGRAAVK